MIKDPCGTCESTAYFYWRVVVDAKGNRFEECSECSSRPQPALSPDVYFDSSKGAFQTDPNLCDRYTGPIPFSSKREKAAVMKRLGLQEAGDKEHGSRNFDKAAHKNNWKNNF